MTNSNNNYYYNNDNDDSARMSEDNKFQKRKKRKNGNDHRNGLSNFKNRSGNRSDTTSDDNSKTYGTLKPNNKDTVKKKKYKEGKGAHSKGMRCFMGICLQQ